ncbi:DNA polymerase/3'-5' exonuclease PolX [Candidatus Woesearchaeota archaeon]|nr:DNA polymerase/3'-5' exonuclease PolX [Candidatus Woesearchaeota archaeon]
MKNLDIAKILYNIADILELQEVLFKPLAYRKVALALESLSEDAGDIYTKGGLKALMEIPGVGEHIAVKMEEIIQTGKLKYYDDLKKEIKVDIEQLNKIPTLGPKKIKLLYQELGIKTVDDLEKAILQGKLRDLHGFGEETEKNLLKGIELIKTRPQRFLYAHALPLVQEITRRLQQGDGVQRVEITGSFRRGKETVGDLDFLVISDKAEKVVNLFTAMPDVKEVLAKGSTRSSVRLTNGLQVDLRVLKEKEFGSAMLYFIGNKEHNVELRKLALRKGYTLSEYGLFRLKGKRWVAGRTEDEVYKKLGLQYIEPELRENTGEIPAAMKGILPRLVTAKDINGVFHNHSIWSDGNNSLLEMAQKAEQLGLKFISFNDHFGHMGITNPLNEKRLTGYLKEIEKVRKKVGLRVLSGVEIDILKDGTLPLSAKKLKEFDVVIASVHVSLKMSEEEMTKRVCNALENYPLNILGHPTGRILNEREPMAINLERVFDVAKRRNVFMEINGSPGRMDLSGLQVKAAKEAGCLFALSTDGHDISHLPFYRLGVLSARRGWLEKKDLLNHWSIKRIEKALKE